MNENKIARIDEIIDEINTLRDEAVSIVSEMKNSTYKEINHVPEVRGNQNRDVIYSQNKNLNKHESFNEIKETRVYTAKTKKVDVEKIISKYIIPVLASVLIFVGLISLAFMVEGRTGDALQVLVMYMFSGIFCVAGHKVTKSKVRVLGESLVGCGIGSLFITTYLTYAFYYFINQNTMIILMLILATVFTVISEKYSKSVFRIIAQIGTIFPIFDLVLIGDITTAICILAITSTIMILLSQRNDYMIMAVQNTIIQLQLFFLLDYIYFEIHMGAMLLPVIYIALLLLVFIQNIFHYATNHKIQILTNRVMTVVMLVCSFIGFSIGVNAIVVNLEHLLLVVLAVSYGVVSLSLYKRQIGISDFVVTVFYSLIIAILTVNYLPLEGFLVRDLFGVLPLILLIYFSREEKNRNVMLYVLLLFNLFLLFTNSAVGSYFTFRHMDNFFILSVLWYVNYISILCLLVYDFFRKQKLFRFRNPCITAINSWVVSLSLPLLVSIFVADPSMSEYSRSIIYFISTKSGNALCLISFITVYMVIRHASFLKKYNSINLNDNNRVMTEVVECVIALWGCSSISDLARNPESYAVLLQSILAICIIGMTMLSFKETNEFKSIYRYIKTLIIISFVLRNLLVGDFTGAVIGLVWLVLASILILCGFKYTIREVRLYGLYLAIIAVIRLVLIDIPSNSSAMTVLLYIVGGIICFGIVFIYNKTEVRYKIDNEQINKEF